MSEHLLLIGHDADTATLVTGALHEAGFTVHRAASDHEALGFLATNPVTGIVLDPDPALGDPLRTLRELHHLCERVLIITARRDTRPRRAGRGGRSAIGPRDRRAAPR